MSAISSTKPDAWTLSPQMTAAPELWRDVTLCAPFWEGQGSPNNISTWGPLDPGTTSNAWVRNRDGLAMDFSTDRFSWLEAETALDGSDELTVVVIIKSSATGIDKGIYNSGGSSPADPDLQMRYDSSGFSGGQSNVIKFGLDTGTDSGASESSGGVQTTDIQHLAMRWRSGTSPELFIDGAKDNLSSDMGEINGTLGGGSRWFGFRLGEGGQGNLWDGQIQFALNARRRWTEAEIARHAADPYEMLRPAGF